MCSSVKVALPAWNFLLQGLFSCVSYISKPLSGSVSPNQSTTEFFVGLSFVLVFWLVGCFFLIRWVPIQ